MTPARAREIIGAINDRAFYSMGIVDKVGSLKGVTLAEMVEAAAMVKDGNSAPSVDGKKTINVVPAERLIAAVFALEHFDHDDEAIAGKPIRDFRGDLKLIAVQIVERAAAEQEDAA